MNFNDVLALMVVNILPIACAILIFTIPMNIEYVILLLFIAGFAVETDIPKKK